MPRLIEYYLGEQPLLGDVPTYLCGRPEQRAEVLGRLDELVLKPVDGYGGDRVRDRPPRRARRSWPRSGGRSSPPRTAGSPRRWSRCRPTRSSTATALAPRHVDLRAFVFLGEQPPRSRRWR